MQKKMRSPVFLLPVLFCVLLFTAAAGCSPRTQLVGTYIAEIKDSPNRGETTLELEEIGTGVWKVGDDEVPFSWHVKGNELRLYTRNGGIIVGNMDNRIIHVTLPGSKELLFRKVK
ncbi:MAG: hypothetical protein ABSF52_11100 [Syntrophobacteraceae bacterium]|jgi:hypothetical protein